jgi:hypothetical protein
MPALPFGSRSLSCFGELVLVQGHINFPASESDSFGLQAEALLEGIISAEFYSASGA